MGNDDGTVPKGSAIPRSGAPGLAKRRSAWVAVAGILLVGGTLSAALAAVSLGNSDAARSRQAFEASSAEIASTLELAIEHEDDLITSADGFIAGNPNASNTEFRDWGTSVSALARYPELVGLARGTRRSGRPRVVGDPGY